MNWDQIEGNWKQIKGAAKTQWGKLTNDDMEVLTGKRDTLVGKVQERYGIAKAEAEKQVDAWSKSVTAMAPANPMHAAAPVTHGATPAASPGVTHPAKPAAPPVPHKMG